MKSIRHIALIMSFIISCDSNKPESLTPDELRNELDQEFPDDKENLDELYDMLQGKEDTTELQNIEYNSFSEFELGKLKKRVYSNDYFGFTLDVPADWKILSKSEEELRVSQTQAELKEKDESFDSKIENSKANYFNLFSICKNESLPAVTFLAEKIDPIPNVTNAIEYLEYTREFIVENFSEGYPVYTNGSIVLDSIGSKHFLLQTFEIEEENEFYYQKTFCAQYDGYLLNIITNYKLKEDFADIRRLLDKIVWKEE